MQAAVDGMVVSVSIPVRNVGAVTGKTSVQLYVSAPTGKMDKPYQELAAFGKTKALTAGEEERLCLSFDLSDMASFDTVGCCYVLEAGDYILRVGEDSRTTSVAGVIRLDQDVVTKRVKNITRAPKYKDYIPAEAAKSTDIPKDVDIITVSASEFKTEVTNYDHDYEVDETVKSLSDDLLIKMNIGSFDPKGGMAGIIGNSGTSVAGAAGQTCLEAEEKGIRSLVMADGPAGLRLHRDYVRTKGGSIKGLGNSIPESMMDLFPKIVKLLMRPYKPKRGDVIYHQYATALPIATAIAQSFNIAFATECGSIVGSEMDRFGVDLWLAPALNIQRDIRCGRNFEYFSEDPVVSGEFSAAITNGVQSHRGRGTTIKHFACNNQEFNRTQNNSVVSERTLREIYLKGFAIAVKKSAPKAIMTSYNLINGVHASEMRELIEDYMRRENGYEGIVMTDWVVSGYASVKGCKYPVACASKVVMAGGDLFMPGSKNDYDDIKKGLEEGIVIRRQLEVNATRVKTLFIEK